MNNNSTDNPNRKKHDAAPVNVGIWISTLFVGHALGAAIAVGLAGLILNIAPRSLLAPYAGFVYCGLVFASLLYWARLARQQPRSCARRFAIAMFLYLQVVILAIGWSAVKLGVLSSTATLDDLPLTVVFSAIACIAIYVAARQMLEARKS